MRWQQLFADLEAQLEAAAAADLETAVAEVTRAERAKISLADRLRATQGEIDVVVRGGEHLSGHIADVSSEWVLLTVRDHQVLIPFTAVVTAQGIAQSAQLESSLSLRRLGLGSALRALSRDRVTVRWVADGFATLGRIDVVGVDYVELRVGDELRPSSVLAATFAALRYVRSV